ncbi:Piwi domain-containing protein [Xylaria sp. CBS 124048]|nr:Piwi domain-containing protein [Xylaria sp. CBS 124048]
MSGLRPPKNLLEKMSNLDLDSKAEPPRGSTTESLRGSAAGSHRGSHHGSQAGGAAGSKAAKAAEGSKIILGPDGKEIRDVDIVGRRVDLPADAYLADGSQSRFTKRPAFNTEGKEIKVDLNIFPVLAFNDLQTVYQYDVSISPNPTQSRALVKKVWASDAVKKALSEAGGKWLYDGNKLAWSSKEIPHNGFLLTVDIDTDKPRRQKVVTTGTFRVEVRQIKTIKLSSLYKYLNGSSEWDKRILECMNLIDHCMRQGPSEGMLQIRRNFYPNNATREALGSVVEVRKGYYAAARLSQAKSIMINIDTVNTAFWQVRNVSDIALRMFNYHDKKYANYTMHQFGDMLKPVVHVDAQKRCFWKQSEIFTLLRRLQKLKFHVKHRAKMNDPKLYTIRHFIWADYYGDVGAHSQNVKFDKKMPDGTVKSTTVYDHYIEAHDIRLQYPKLPIIETTRGGLFPMELCMVAPDQRYPFKLDPTQTAAMIKFAVTRPPKRRKDILDGADALDYPNDGYLAEFGIKVSPKMQQTSARLLPHPEVAFAGNARINPGVSGRWDLRGKRFLEPNAEEMISWGLVVCGNSCTKADAEAFGMKFAQAYRAHGANVKTPIFITQIPFQFGDYGKICAEAWDRIGQNFKMLPQMIFFVVPNRNVLVYERIKKNMDCKYCCPSQIIQGGHVSKANPQYLSNVAMKVNAKLGGVTCKAVEPGNGPIGAASQFFKEPTMMIGVDVSHASPGSGAPSMAAITVSMDKNAIRFSAACQTNGWRDEILDPDTAISAFTPLLRKWYDAHGLPPTHVYYFRDGVDEGQFKAVIDMEVAVFRRIFREKNCGTPKFTVIIATKRHHIRFFPNQSNRGAGDRNGNPLPGTLVERDATHPHHFDFYLCSHVAIQGTARPVHYQVIYDEAKVIPDELQKMIYHQCYQYVRSTTPVSLHPAIYYAHVASNRARSHEDIASFKKEVPVPRAKLGNPAPRKDALVYPKEEQEKLVKPLPLLPMDSDFNFDDSIAFMNTTMWYI